MIVTLSTAAALPLLLWRSKIESKEMKRGETKRKTKRNSTKPQKKPGNQVRGRGRAWKRETRSRSEKGFLSFLAKLGRCKSNEDHFFGNCIACPPCLSRSPGYTTKSWAVVSFAIDPPRQSKTSYYTFCYFAVSPFLSLLLTLFCYSSSTQPVEETRLPNQRVRKLTWSPAVIFAFFALFPTRLGLECLSRGIACFSQSFLPPEA